MSDQPAPMMAEADKPSAPVSSTVSGSSLVSSTTSDNSAPECPVAYLETPEGRRIAYRKREGSQPGVVFVHGLQSTMMGEKAAALDEYCHSKGISFVRFDMSGHGESSEKFTETNVSIWLEDLTAVMDSLTSGPQVLIGSSMGGWLVFLYTMRNPENVAGLVGIASAVDFTQRLWKGLDKAMRQEVNRSGVYHMPSPYLKDPIELTMDFILDGEKHGILDMPGMCVPALCLMTSLFLLRVICSVHCVM